jgi:hypothetical protein
VHAGSSVEAVRGALTTAGGREIQVVNWQE